MLTRGGMLSLDRKPSRVLSQSRQSHDVPCSVENLPEGFYLFETVPALSCGEKTSSILETHQLSFEEFAVRIIYARGLCRHLQHLSSHF